MFEIQSWKVQTLKLELQQLNVQRLHFNVEKIFAGKLARNFFAGIASLYIFAGNWKKKFAGIYSLYIFAGNLSREIFRGKFFAGIFSGENLYENGHLKMKPSSAS